MQIRMVTVAAATMFVVAGCADQADLDNGPQPRSVAITVDSNAQTMGNISCTQVGWLLSIDATADPAQARAMLRLGGVEPIPLTVNLENFDDFHGVSGEYVDDAGAKATFDDGTYTITGTARGLDVDNPSNDRTVDFRIEARC